MNKKISTLFTIFSLLFIFAILLYITLRIFIPQRWDVPKAEIEVKIKTGMTVRAIAQELETVKIIQNAQDFILAAKLLQETSNLKAGRYSISPRLSVYTILKIISEGKISNSRIVIPEGLTSYQIASILENKLEIDSSKFVELVTNQNYISNFERNVNSLEGYLFPNTYYFPWGITEKEIIKIMVDEFWKNVTDSIQTEVAEKGWTLHQIITLASIIEGEAMIDSERVIVSAVYHNRLRRGILLQADPTIQYIIPDGPRRLLNKDLAIDSPYNTYRYIGLPPGPVNNPGIKSILAALRPADVDYIYFVAKGDGSHVFSRTLREHNEAKRKFDEYRKMINRKKKLDEAERN